MKSSTNLHKILIYIELSRSLFLSAMSPLQIRDIVDESTYSTFCMCWYALERVSDAFIAMPLGLKSDLHGLQRKRGGGGGVFVLLGRTAPSGGFQVEQEPCMLWRIETLCLAEFRVVLEQNGTCSGCLHGSPVVTWRCGCKLQFSQWSSGLPPTDWSLSLLLKAPASLASLAGRAPSSCCARHNLSVHRLDQLVSSHSSKPCQAVRIFQSPCKARN